MSRLQAPPVRVFLVALSAVVLMAAGCGTPAPPASNPPVSDEEATQFVARAEQFYAQLQGVPLPATITFSDRRLHEYFPNPSAFSDYFSSLATSARQRTFRDGTARSVAIREFHFDGPDQAVVRVVFTGKHERELRFWDIEIERQDVWRRIDGIWLIVPEKL